MLEIVGAFGEFGSLFITLLLVFFRVCNIHFSARLCFGERRASLFQFDLCMISASLNECMGIQCLTVFFVVKNLCTHGVFDMELSITQA